MKAFKRNGFAVLYIVVLMLLTTAGLAQDSLNIKLVSNLIDRWQYGSDLEIDGDLIYVGCGYDGVWIFNIDEPDLPQYVSRFLVGENVEGITVVDDIAYIIIRLQGLFHIVLVDVSDPSQPEELSRIEVNNVLHTAAEGPEISEGYLYLGVRMVVDNEQPHFLGVWDVRDPANPELVSGIDDAPELSDVTIEDDRLYGIFDSRYLRVYDISDPHNIQRLGFGRFVGNYHNIKVFGGHVFGYRNADPNRFSAFDVSDPDDIREVWFTEDIRQVDDMVAIGEYLFVARGFEDERGWNQGMVVLDIADPAEPEWVTIYINDGTQDLTSLASNEDFLYSLSFNYSQLKVWDVINPMNCEVIFVSENEGNIHDVEVLKDVVYVTYSGWDGIGVVAYSMQVHNNPRYLGATWIMPDAHAPTSSMFGNNLFITGRGAPFDAGGIRILNVDDPERPELIYRGPGNAYEVEVKDDIAYLAEAGGGLRILDLADPTDPEELAVIPVGHHATRVRVEGNRMLFTDIGHNDTAWVVDIRDPGNPRKTGWFRPNDNIKYKGFDITDRSIVFGGALRVRDLRDPHVEIVESFNTLWTGTSWEMMFLNDTLLARIDHRRGLSVYQFTGEAPEYDSCFVVGYYAFDWGKPEGLAFEYPWLYAAGGGNVAVFDLRPLFGDTLEENSVGKVITVPRGMSLAPPYPNPFNSTTTISYELPYSDYISLQVYNLSGQQTTTLFEGYLQAGLHSTNLTDNNLSSGLYFLRLKASEQVFTRKVMLIK
ncbi:MAG: T9SS type A sorting domain-containing protein [Candidatus Hatepunaea meridiana]|nr:T9SS type A sorting domain-containing protein [Candidatus Hatepunaea meridiana]